MTTSPSVEPLFAHNASLWLRIWIVAQGVASLIATLVALDRTGPRAASAARIALFLIPFVITHVVGFTAYAWLLRHRVALLAYLLACWGVIVQGAIVDPAFGILLLGGILQGFIFLPFAWAALVLVLITVTLATAVGYQARGLGVLMILSRVGALLGIGVTTGTILAYIHRANREAAVRSALLAQLDVAQQGLADRAREAGIVAERQRLAHDIHDTLAQGFASVIQHLEAIDLGLPSSARPVPDESWVPQVRKHLGHAQTVSRSSLAEIRRLVHALRPSELSNAPLAAALERVVHQWGEAHGIRATFTSDDVPALRQDAEVVLLRATQESLSNVARHASATSVVISLTCIDGLVMLTVEDDGAGFSPADASGNEAVGLSAMRERARRLGGHVLVDSSPGEGTSLTLAMPLTTVAASTRDAGLTP